MLRNERFRRKMFDKWDDYTMEQIKLRIGEAKLTDERLAGMLVKYIQNYRVYLHNPPIKPQI
ncbi:hypothetical protein GQ600_5094 [Phytophthora cactorum]|nr:hypothetical protein GQ600_5094 [Phytophthora cactorum]